MHAAGKRPKEPMLAISAHYDFRFLASFGAILAVVALAMGPFAQQIVVYRTRSIEPHTGASLKSASNYTAALRETAMNPVPPHCGQRKFNVSRC